MSPLRPLHPPLSPFPHQFPSVQTTCGLPGDLLLNRMDPSASTTYLEEVWIRWGGEEAGRRMRKERKYVEILLLVCFFLSFPNMSFNISVNHPHCHKQVLFRELSPQENDTFSYTVTGLLPWTQYEFAVRSHNPAGHAHSSWSTVTTKQAPPSGLGPPTVSHLQGRPSELLVSWTPPLEPNGVLQSYRIQRNNVTFSFSFDPTVLSYTDEDLLPFESYR